MRRVSAARRVVDHERPVGLDLVQHLDVVDGLIGHRRNQIPTGMTKIGLNRRGVAKQVVWFPLAGVVADETIKIVEALNWAARPVVERAGWACLPLRDVVILAVPRRVVAILLEDFTNADGVAWNDAVVSGVAGRLIDYNAGADRVVIVAGEQRGSRRRAERRGMEARIAQARLRDAVERRRRYHATEGAGRTKTDIVGHDEQDVRRTLRRHHTGWPIWLRLRSVGIDLPTKRLGWRWQIATVNRR